MSYSISKRLLLLAMHPRKNRFIVSSQVLNIGLCGALLMELSNLKLIKIENDVVVYTHSKTKPEKYLLEINNKIKEYKKPRKMKRWISALNINAGKYRWQVAESMEHDRLLRIRKKRFLFIPYREPHLLNHSARNHEISRIRGIILKHDEAENDDISVMALLYACKMHRILSRNRNEAKIIRKKLKEILESNLIAGGTDKVIKEMQSGIMAAIAASSATAVAASSQ